MIWSRKTRFRDMPAMPPEAPRSKSIAFFAPHTSEHPAVMPLISELGERLGSAGSSTETHSVDNMRDSVLSLSAKLNPFRFSKKGKRALESFFRMKDAVFRLQVLEGILKEDPGKIVVEMHALPKDYKMDEQFPWADYYYRIPRTRILFPRDLRAEYEVPIREGMSQLGNDAEESVSFAKRLLGLEQMDRREAEAILACLETVLERTLLIEIPAASKPGMDMLVHTEFEMNYGIRRSEAHSLRTSEIQELLSLLS